MSLILSWDVGIINLAYCIMKLDTNGNFVVRDWGKLDLRDESQFSNLICPGIGKDGSKCTRPCRFYVADAKKSNSESETGSQIGPDSDTESDFDSESDSESDSDSDSEDESKFKKNNSKIKGYCGIHSKKVSSALITYTGKQSCTHSYKNKDKKCPYKVSHVYYTPNPTWKKKKDQFIVSYYCPKHKPGKTSFLKLIKKTGSNKMPIENLQINLLRKLLKYPQFLQVDTVIIENQPALKNPRMKAISSTLYDYFLIRSTIDKHKFPNQITKVSYINARTKKKVITPDFIKQFERQREIERSEYKKRTGKEKKKISTETLKI